MSLLPLTILLLLPSFILFSVLLPFSFFFVVLFIAAAAVFDLSFSFSQTQWHISIDVVVFESSSSFFLSGLRFFLCCHRCCLLCLLHVGKSPSTFFEFVPAASFTCASVVSLTFLCRCVHLTTRSLSFISSFLSHLSTAHSRCDEFFDVHLTLDLCFDVLVFDVLEASALACFYHHLASD